MYSEHFPKIRPWNYFDVVLFTGNTGSSHDCNPRSKLISQSQNNHWFRLKLVFCIYIEADRYISISMWYTDVTWLCYVLSIYAIPVTMRIYARHRYDVTIHCTSLWHIWHHYTLYVTMAYMTSLYIVRHYDRDDVTIHCTSLWQGWHHYTLYITMAGMTSQYIVHHYGRDDITIHCTSLWQGLRHYTLYITMTGMTSLYIVHHNMAGVLWDLYVF